MLKQILFTFIFAMTAILSLHADTELYTKPSRYPVNATQPNLKVLLARNTDGVQVEVNGRYKVYDPQNNGVISSGVFGKNYPIHATNDGIKWGEEYPSIYQIAIVPDSPRTPVLVNGIPYYGILYAYLVNQKINLVNEVPIEYYLKSVLSNEDANHSEEVLASIAIIARTNAYYERIQSKNSFWQVDASLVRYRGNVDRPPTKMDEAIDATKYFVLRSTETTENGGLFPASWTEDCAGKTVEPNVMLRKALPDYRCSVDSSIAAAHRLEASWSFSKSKEELTKLAGLSPITGISLFVDNASGKVYGIRFESPEGHKDFDFFQVQNMLGPDNLKSSDFTLAISPESVTFNGYGIGHGIGLCLYSAEQMADMGASAPKILGKFFPKTVVAIVPNLPKPYQKNDNPTPMQTLSAKTYKKAEAKRFGVRQ